MSTTENEQKPVTEVDFRRPEYQFARVEDYERTRDGGIARKDRWYTAFTDLARAARIGIPAIDGLPNAAFSLLKDEILAAKPAPTLLPPVTMTSSLPAPAKRPPTAAEVHALWNKLVEQHNAGFKSVLPIKEFADALWKEFQK
ncbi:hypothetical protein FDI24_gp182 [Acidovorax phage ACP17]|uniref:Uncharacterized protein n=1 Tax=Acidovorax phage ACP17 TaxID=2010329 RepID=A0A218M341_9CAUD|nr:hypothetical protein FDI24_gp182 [Acidovorax phage ACP17]ASD50464.1 hypothetical protein [Acidovorax phage ACP17]